MYYLNVQQSTISFRYGIWTRYWKKFGALCWSFIKLWCSKLQTLFCKTFWEIKYLFKIHFFVLSTIPKINKSTVSLKTSTLLFSIMICFCSNHCVCDNTLKTKWNRKVSQTMLTWTHNFFSVHKTLVRRPEVGLQLEIINITVNTLLKKIIYC